MTASSEDPTAEDATARPDQPDAASRPLPRRSKGPSAIAAAAAALGPAADSESGDVADDVTDPGSVSPPRMSAAAAEFAAFTERTPGGGQLGGRTAVPAGHVTGRGVVGAEAVDRSAFPSHPHPHPGPRPRSARRRGLVLAVAATAVVLLTGSLLLMGGGDGKGGSAADTGSDAARAGGEHDDVTDSSDAASPSGESSALEADPSKRPTPKAGSSASGKDTAHARATATVDAKNGGAPSGSSTPAAQSTAAAKGVLIRGHGSGRCIDVSGGNPVDNTRLQIWDCTGAARQQWRFGSDGTVRALGKCMDVDGGSRTDGAWIKLVTCNGTGAQRFRLNAAHDLVNLQADKCVDVTDAGTGNGAELQLWSCTGGDNQKWSAG
ncbi:ricin-type beta-trefoil lectin domain protein [Streptomyces sp. NPDC091280]|uniref:ricin-type beta-trefoil lectin domain protein n=1 Tax=Streptomyces sp. NPDC091280 TaxID=3365984 RepID=UPI003801309F